MAKTYCIILVMVLTTLLCKTFPVQKGRSHAAMRARRATIPLAGKNGKWKMGTRKMKMGTITINHTVDFIFNANTYQTIVTVPIPPCPHSSPPFLPFLCGA